MKRILTLIMLVLAASISLVSASHFTSGPSYFRTRSFGPFNERSQFDERGLINRDFFNRNSLLDFSNRDVFNQFNSFNNQENQLFSNGFTRDLFQNFMQNNNVDFNDGFNLNKGPCSTRNLKADFRGRENDFKILETVCDNIEGNFFRDNSLNNNVVNNFGFNTNEFANNNFMRNFENTGRFNRDFSLNNRNLVTENRDVRFLETNFGKGSLIVLN